MLLETRKQEIYLANIELIDVVVENFTINCKLFSDRLMSANCQITVMKSIQFCCSFEKGQQ